MVSLSTSDASCAAEVAVRACGQDSGQEPVEQDAERVHVRGGRDGLAEDLLRSGVARREHALLDLREVGGARLGREDLGDPEVEQLDLAVFRDEHVGGLDVAVDDEAPVRGVHRVAARRDQVQALVERESVLADELRDRLAFDQFQHEIRTAVRRPAVEQPRDVGMVEAGEELPLLHEAPPDSLGVDPFAQQLQGDALLVLAVAPLGDPDLAHASTSEQGDENVGADRLARRAVGFGRRMRAERTQPRRVLGGAALEEGAGCAVGREQLAHEPRERGVGGLEGCQPRSNLFGRELHELAEDDGGLPEARLRPSGHGWAAGGERLR